MWKPYWVLNLLIISTALSGAGNLTMSSPAQSTPASPGSILVARILAQDEHVQHLDRDSVLVIIFVSFLVALIILSACRAFYFWQRMGLISDQKKVRSSDSATTISWGEERLDVYAKLASIPALLPQSRNWMLKGHAENEMSVLSNAMHMNIISPVGYCVHWETWLLVYELMQRGPLEKQLHGMALTWSIRVKIALDVARGLEFLHEHCSPRVIHRDLNSSSILLDLNFNAKISGFRHAVAGGSGNENRKKGSAVLGYEAPEYLINGELTEKSDVYALGVVMLELLVGRKLAGESFLTSIMPQLADRDRLPNIVDPVIRRAMDTKHLCQVAAIAVLCVQPEPSYRPLIKEVVHSLIPLVPRELGGSLGNADPNS